MINKINLSRISLLISFAILLSFSCKKGNENNSLDFVDAPFSHISASDINKFEALRSMATSEARKLAFSALTNLEKSNFWVFHLSKSMGGLTPQQKRFIMEVRERLTPAAYIEASNENKVVSSLLIPQWIAKANTILMPDQISTIFYFLQQEQVNQSKANKVSAKEPKVSDKVMVLGPPLEEPLLPDCMCNLGSSFTCKKMVTHIGTDGIWQEVTYGSCSNTGNGCKVDNWGCGWAGLFYCNGNTCTY